MAIPNAVPATLLILLIVQGAQAFIDIIQPTTVRTTDYIYQKNHALLSMALGDYSVELHKPLGIILQERSVSGSSASGIGGVQVKELAEGGSAATQTQIVPGDILLQINDLEVSNLDFDSVMNYLLSLDTESSPAKITLGDGLGQLNMPKNVVKLLKTTEDAFFVDAVVRAAARELRRRNAKLGDLLNVEVIIGAGVKDEETGESGKRRRRGQVRFFAIFSTDGGVTSYSCNVSATGLLRKDESVEIVTLSAAKDEGLGQTYEFI